jgi:hypothetical protein
MNVPSELANKVIENLKGTPFVMTILVINVIVLAGFAVTLYHIDNAIERRDKILERCIK